MSCCWNIVWHPVMIWDIIQRLNNNVSLCLDWEYDMSASHEFMWVFLKRNSFWYWQPIDEQSDECIDYIYSLLNNG